MVIPLDTLVALGLASNKERNKMVLDFLSLRKRLALYNWTYLSLVFL
jgi:hypothetical protein